MRHVFLRFFLSTFACMTAAHAYAEAYENDYSPEIGRFRFEVKEQVGGQPQVMVKHDPSACQFTPYGSPTPCELRQSQLTWEPRLAGDGVGVDHIEGQWSRFRFEGVDELARFRLIRLHQNRTNQSIVRLLVLDDDGRVTKVYRLNKVAE